MHINFYEKFIKALNYITENNNITGRSLKFEDNVYDVICKEFDGILEPIESKNEFFKKYPDIRNDLTLIKKEKKDTNTHNIEKRPISKTNFILKAPYGTKNWPDILICYNYKYYMLELKTSLSNQIACGATLPTINSIYIIKYKDSDITKCIYLIAQELFGLAGNKIFDISHKVIGKANLQHNTVIHAYIRPHYQLAISKNNTLDSLNVKENVYNFLKSMEE